MTSLDTGYLLESEPPCPICEGRERRVVSNVGRNFEQLTTVICTGCGLVHSHPMPSKDELHHFYANHYRKKYKATFEPKLKHLYRYAPGAYQRAQVLRTLAGPDQTRFLDIGSGSGELLYMARKMGFDIAGIEPNTGYAEYTQRELDLPVRNCTYEDANLTETRFDVINLNHVLEHLPDPLETIRFINQCLNNNGILCVSVPNIEGSRHAPWTRFHYAHVYNFCRDTLRAIVLKSGFEIVESASSSTTVVARKVTEDFDTAPYPNEDTYTRLWAELSEWNTMAHVAGKNGVRRLLGKAYRYPREAIIARAHGSPRKILDHVFAREAKGAAIVPAQMP